MPENTAGGTGIGSPYTATDTNSDDITYTLKGTDAALFTIDEHSGQVATARTTKLDFEQTPNRYSIIVTADDAQGGTAKYNVTVNETDVQEQPETPAQPTVHDISSTGANFRWTKPGNSGPPINEYRTRYSTTIDGPWTEQTHIASTRELVLTNLLPGTKYYFQVQANNSELWSEFSPMAETTLDPNSLPTFVDPDNIVIDFLEHTPANTDIGSTISATDDETTTITYAISGADAVSFNFNTATSQISTKSGVTYDFERDQIIYTLTVTATDQHDGQTTKSVTINVEDVEEQPDRPNAPTRKNRAIESITVQWTEPGLNGGPDITGYDLRYIKVGDDQSDDNNWIPAASDTQETEFTLDQLDRGASYHFQVLAHNGETDSMWSPNSTIGTTANSTPTFQDTNSSTIEVSENTPGGSDIGSPYTVNDPDNDTIVFTITGTNAALFTIDGSTGQVATAANTELNFEESPNRYSITVIADDNQGTTARYTVTISETDVQEQPETPAQPTVHDISSTGATFRWTEPANTGPDINQYRTRHATSASGPWTIETSSGSTTELVLTGLTPGSVYYFQVQANNTEIWSDYSPAAEATLDQNATPQFINTDSIIEIEIPENTAANQPVGDPITATDAEMTTITYALSGTDADKFTFKTSTAQISTSSEVEYNFEGDQTSYSITVTATDEHNGTTTKEVTVTLTDVEEPPAAPNAPTKTEQTSTSFTIKWEEPENTGPPITGYAVQFKSGSSPEWTDHIHDDTSRSSIIANLQPSKKFQAHVNATNDEGTSPWSEELTISTSTNRPPVIRPPTNQDPNFVNNSYLFEIPEDAAPSTTVGTISAQDPENSTITYSIPSTGDADSFAIDSQSGLITTADNAAFDYETKTSYTFQVSASDPHGGSDSMAVTVAITNIAEPPLPPVLSAAGSTLTTASTT